MQPGKSKKKRARRYHELTSVFNWISIQQQNNSERDYIILGDMNVYKCDRLDNHLINGFTRANKQCFNSNLRRTYPYDQVLYNKAYTHLKDYRVIDMFEYFNIPKSTPNKKIIAKYSDHHPIFFTILNEKDDDLSNHDKVSKIIEELSSPFFNLSMKFADLW